MILISYSAYIKVNRTAVISFISGAVTNVTLLGKPKFVALIDAIRQYTF
jgi:hypothetical protein